MRLRIIKTCFVYLLIVTTFTSSPSLANIEDLGLESSKAVLRVFHALRNGQTPDLSTELPPDTPDREETAHNVIKILSLFFKNKITRINATHMKKLREFQDRFQGEELLTYQRFLHEWQAKKECKYGQCTPSLERNFNEFIESEIMSDFIFVEEPAPQTSPIASTSTLPTRIDNGILEVISGFVLIDEFYSSTEGGFITSRVISPAEAARLSEPQALLSLVAVPSTSMPIVLEEDTSSSSTDTPPESEDVLLTSTDISSALVAAPSTSTDTSPVLAVMPSTPTVHDALLQELDKESAIIILESILNGYRIPSKKFNLKSKTDQDRYGKVVAYLMWVLHNKKEKVLHQKAALNPDHLRYRFDSDWYDSKLVKYEKSRQEMTSPDIPSGKSFFANILSRFTSIVPQSQVN